jgi:hypothetical protein
VAVRACLSEQTGSEAAEVQEHRAPMTAIAVAPSVSQLLLIRPK